MGNLLKYKFKAAGIHLGISAIVFLGILYLILIEWYPGVLFDAEGGWTGIKIMAAVDLVLGPSLTFIIFNHMKARKEIIFDLTVIVIIQIGALIWGGMQVYESRPVALVMWHGIFYTVTEDYYNMQDVDISVIKKLSDEKPLLVYAETENELEALEELQRLNKEKIPPYAQVHLYRSVKDAIDDVMDYKITSAEWSEHLPEDAFDTSDNVFLGKAKYRDILIYLDDDANMIELRLR